MDANVTLSRDEFKLLAKFACLAADEALFNDRFFGRLLGGKFDFEGAKDARDECGEVYAVILRAAGILTRS